MLFFLKIGIVIATCLSSIESFLKLTEIIKSSILFILDNITSSFSITSYILNHHLSKDINESFR